jgi:hypothetical protein
MAAFDVELFAFLKDVLVRLCNGQPMDRLDELIPWNRDKSEPWE